MSFTAIARAYFVRGAPSSLLSGCEHSLFVIVFTVAAFIFVADACVFNGSLFLRLDSLLKRVIGLLRGHYGKRNCLLPPSRPFAFFSVTSRFI